MEKRKKIRESDNVYFLLNQFPSTIFQFFQSKNDKNSPSDTLIVKGKSKSKTGEK